MASVSKVASITDSFLWSKNHLARMAKMSRDTVTKKLADAGVEPAASHRKYPVYDAREALPHLLDFPVGKRTATAASVFTDPDFLPMKDRRDYFQSEVLRLQVGKEKRDLIPIDEFTQRLATILQAIAGGLDRIPGDLESRLDLTPEITEAIDLELDHSRVMLQTKLQEILREARTGDESQANIA